jgi:hypothetical protein
MQKFKKIISLTWIMLSSASLNGLRYDLLSKSSYNFVTLRFKRVRNLQKGGCHG